MTLGVFAVAPRYVSPPGHHQNAISAVLHFRPNAYRTTTNVGFHQSGGPYGKKTGYLDQCKTESVCKLLYNVLLTLLHSKHRALRSSNLTHRSVTVELYRRLASLYAE